MSGGPGQHPGSHGDPLNDPLPDQTTAATPPPPPASPPPSTGTGTTVSEEHAVVGTELHDTGSIRARKHVETRQVEQTVPREVEHADTERHDVEGEDTGEVITLEDGSISIPVFEEVLVVTKKLVVRERIVVRKHTVVDEYTLRTELRREHVDVDVDDDVEVDDRRGDPRPG